MAYNWPLGAAVSMVVLVLTISLLWLSTQVEKAMNYAGESASSREVGMAGRAV